MVSIAQNLADCTWPLWHLTLNEKLLISLSAKRAIKPRYFIEKTKGPVSKYAQSARGSLGR